MYLALDMVMFPGLLHKSKETHIVLRAAGNPALASSTYSPCFFRMNANLAKWFP